MSVLHNLLAEPITSPVPALRNVAAFGVDAHTRVSARQTALEPSTAGADHAMSWSGWVNQSNLGTNSMRFFGVQQVASANAQYVCQTTSQDTSTPSRNQRLNFTMFTDGANFMTIESTNKFLRARSTFIAITYTGSETTAGLKMYINGVRDTTAALITGGTYTGARNDANNRFAVSRVDSSATRFKGDMRDLAVWNRVLTDAEVLELYNGGTPFDISTTSFYAGAIVSWWSMVGNLTSANNAAYNLGDTFNVTFRNIPFSPTYETLTFFNADPANTRYNAFGSLVRGNPGFNLKTRSGTTHLVNGKLINYSFNPSTLTVAAATDIITDANDLRNAQAGVMDGNKVVVFTSRFNNPTFLDTDYYESTDALAGLTYGSRNDISSILPVGAGVGLTYGKVLRGYVQGEYIVPWYSGNIAGTSKIGLIKRSALGVYSYVPVYSGATAYGEPAIAKVGNNTYIIVMRLVGGVGLHLTYSTDDGANWSVPASTGLGTGECMADMAIAPGGTLTLGFCDRATDILHISNRNVIADVLADPTDWNTASDVFQSYTTDSLGILGYPSLVYKGEKLCIAVSAEFSSSRADVYFGYGLG